MSSSHIREHREVTIFSSEAEEGSVRLNVPLQESYVGTAPAIPASLANVPCSRLGLHGLLAKLNEVLGTSYALPTSAPVRPKTSQRPKRRQRQRRRRPGWLDEDSDDESFDTPFDAPFNTSRYSHPLANLLDIFLHPSRNFDFGIAYAHLRPWWHTPFHIAQQEMFVCELDDTSIREGALSQWSHMSAPSIYPPNLPPRRVWDLYANRVVPAHVVISVGARGQHPNGSDASRVVGISHSWMAENLRQGVRTPINGYEWPVPIPVDTTLDRVRVELLNLGLEYVWLDVLCLRQASPGMDQMQMVGEVMRTEEWKVDVPTIGNVYRDAGKVVHYYSGLGRPFVVGDLSSERHWLNRAWTLQEISPNSIIAGLTPDSPIPPASTDDLSDPDDDTSRFWAKLAALTEFSKEAKRIFPVLDAMRHRASTTELDKIAGLSYLLRSRRLPPYIVEETVEDAWSRFLETIHASYRGEMLFLYPEPGSGEGRWKWAPSWGQVKSAKELPGVREKDGFEEMVEHDSSYHVYRHRGYRFNGFVDGLQDVRSDDSTVPRSGRIVVKDEQGVEHEIPVFARHDCPIPPGCYALHGSSDFKHWVVGRVVESENIEKVSVFCIDGEESVQRLQELGVGQLVNSGFV